MTTKRKKLIKCIKMLANEIYLDESDFIKYTEKRLSTNEEDYKAVFPENQNLIISGDKQYVSNLKVLLAQNLYSNSGKIIEIKDKLSKELDIPQPPIGWYISEKYDGIRAIWDGKKFISRGSSSGNPKVYTYVPDYFKELMPPGIALDGEMWIARGQFKMVSGLSNLKPGSSKNSNEIDKYWRGNGNSKFAVKYKVYDIPSSNLPFEKRMKFLEKIIQDRKEVWENIFEEIDECPIQFTKQTKVENIEQLYSTYKELTSQGAEGVMLRAPNSPYETKRSKYLLKYKIKEDSEAIVRDYIMGTGRLRGLLGSLRCEMIINNSPNGIFFNIGTGFSDIERTEYNDTKSKYYIPIGSVVSFSYMELSEDNIPRHPVYRGLRQDFYVKETEGTEGPERTEDFTPIIQKEFDKLAKNEQAKKEANWQFKKKAYTNVINAMKINREPIKTVKEAIDVLRSSGQKLPGEEAYFLKNGEYKSKIVNKIYEIIRTGSLGSEEDYSKDPKVVAITELCRIPEIGQSTAEKLYTQGIKTIADLKAVYDKNNSIINEKQAIGLLHYEDLEKRIPREEMNIWNDNFIRIFNSTIIELNLKNDKKIERSKIEMVGSYRREAQDSGDIDILITSEHSGNIKKQIMQKFTENLVREKLINEELVFALGDTKFMGLGKIKENYRHIDIFYYSEKEYPFALLFSTGSGQFNVEMRGYSLKKGYSLSDKELQTLNKLGKADKSVTDEEYMEKISKIPENEKDIFDFLNLRYVEPKNRTSGVIRQSN